MIYEANPHLYSGNDSSCYKNKYIVLFFSVFQSIFASGILFNPKTVKSKIKGGIHSVKWDLQRDRLGNI